MKKTALILAGTLAMAFLMSACTLLPAQTQPTAAPEATQAAEDTISPDATETDGGTLEFSLTTLTGDTLDQTVFSDNKLIMVNYWATWCGPCVGEIPDLVKISNEYKDKGFALVGVLKGDDDIDGAKQFIADQGITYPIVLPEAFFLDHSDGIYAIPTTMFFDSNGSQVGETQVGSMTYEDWASLIDSLLGQVS